MARPDRPSVAYIGDGAWGMSLAEVLTCVRENIPTIAVVSATYSLKRSKRNGHLLLSVRCGRNETQIFKLFY